MKNKLTDLNNHLFAQLERLSDEDLKPEQLTIELERSKGVIGISREIVANAQLMLDVQIAMKENQINNGPAVLGLNFEK